MNTVAKIKNTIFPVISLTAAKPIRKNIASIENITVTAT